MKTRIFFFVISLYILSCAEHSSESETVETKAIAKADTMISTIRFSDTKDTVRNGEEVLYHKNGTVQIRGIMKDGKRNGLWKSFYETGIPWSETTFKDGKKNGKTTTWYENGKKRYKGFYSEDIESGKWLFWNEKGLLIETKDYGNKTK